MKKYTVTRSEITTYTVDVFADSYEHAEQIAILLPPENKKWEDKGFLIDYVVQDCYEDDEEEDEDDE